MLKREKGFSLIELMIVIAIIGVLAAIAVPSYANYVKKAQMVEVISLLESFKTELIESYTVTGVFPPTLKGFVVKNAGNIPFSASQNGGLAYTTQIAYSVSASQTVAAVAVIMNASLGGGIPQIHVKAPATAGAPFTTLCGFYQNNLLQLGTTIDYMPSTCNERNLSAGYL